MPIWLDSSPHTQHWVVIRVHTIVSLFSITSYVHLLCLCHVRVHQTGVPVTFSWIGIACILGPCIVTSSDDQRTGSRVLYNSFASCDLVNHWHDVRFKASSSPWKQSSRSSIAETKATSLRSRAGHSISSHPLYPSWQRLQRLGRGDQRIGWRRSRICLYTIYPPTEQGD